MAEITDVVPLLKSKLEAVCPIPITYRNKKRLLPPEPTAFAHAEMIIERIEFAGYGGGRGQNLQRSYGRLEVELFEVKGEGSDAMLALGVTIKNGFIGYRDSIVSTFEAQFFPATGDAPEGNYVNIGTVIVILFFDGIG